MPDDRLTGIDRLTNPELLALVREHYKSGAVATWALTLTLADRLHELLVTDE